MTFKLLKRSRHGIIPEDPGAKEPAAHPETRPQTSATNAGGPTAWQSSQAVSADGREGEHDGVLDALGYNPFAKFTPVANAPLLWEKAAQDLASYAAEVCVSFREIGLNLSGGAKCLLWSKLMRGVQSLLPSSQGTSGSSLFLTCLVRSKQANASNQSIIDVTDCLILQIFSPSHQASMVCDLSIKNYIYRYLYIWHAAAGDSGGRAGCRPGGALHLCRHGRSGRPGCLLGRAQAAPAAGA